MVDEIEIRALTVHGFHGVLTEERTKGQPFTVDVVIEVDLSAAARSDDLADTVDYATLSGQLANAIRDTRFQLIEALAAHLTDIVLADRRVEAVDLRVTKPQAPLLVDGQQVSVRVRRRRGEDRGGP